MLISPMESPSQDKLQTVENAGSLISSGQINFESLSNAGNRATSDQNQALLADNGNTLTIPSVWKGDNVSSLSNVTSDSANYAATADSGRFLDESGSGQGIQNPPPYLSFDSSGSVYSNDSVYANAAGHAPYANESDDSNIAGDLSGSSVWQEAKNAVSNGYHDVESFLGIGSANAQNSSDGSSFNPTLIEEAGLQNSGAQDVPSNSGFISTIAEGAPLLNQSTPDAGHGVGGEIENLPVLVHQPGEDALGKVIENLNDRPVVGPGFQGNVRLGCAQAVSEALNQVDPNIAVTDNLNHLHKELTQQGWSHEEVTANQLDHLPRGAVIFGMRQPGMSGHAAIAEGNGKIFDNSSDLGLMTSEDSVDKFKVPMYNNGKFNADGYERVVVYLPPGGQAA